MILKSYAKNLKAVTLIVWWRLYYGFAQPGEFLSIDCGGQTNRTDTATNITWVTDDNFVDVGYSREIHNSSYPSFYFQSQRAFPKTSKKSCYQLPLDPNVPYLLRIWFVGENYSEGEIPNFRYSIETPGMLSLRIPTAQFVPPIPSENILVSSGKLLYVCLFRSSTVDPFISAIELRPLRPDMYNESNIGMLHLDARYYFNGDKQSRLIRYPQDPFDRRWNLFPVQDHRFRYLNSSRSISKKDIRDRPPIAVLQTLLTPVADNDMLTFTLSAPSTCKSLLLLYFAELELTNASDSRSFQVLINGNLGVIITLDSNHSAIEYPFRKPWSITTFQVKNTSDAAIINAYEHYCVVETERATSPDDIRAISALKQRLNVSKWISDPCFVVPWEGIKCSNSTTTVQIVELSIDNNHLTGELPDISNLTHLERLHLRNNSFSGPIPNWLSKLGNLKELLLDNNQLRGVLPDFLSKLTKLEKLYLQNNRLNGEVPESLSNLPDLKELFIQNNNFSGVIPPLLLSKASWNLLNLTYDDNPNLRTQSSSSNPPSHSKGLKVSILVGAMVVGVLLVSIAAFLGTVLYRKQLRKKETISSKDSVTSKESIHGFDKEYSRVLVPTPTKSRAFTLDEMLKATENFSQKIGQGGFGSVFLGKLDEGKEIAVKVLSSFSKQGVVEFLNEIDLLSKVNHKNLVSLLGYCNDSRELMLVYGYMPRGSLKDHLHGPKTEDYPNLDWKTRLKIVLDAAKGLQYLHIGCEQKIIHRDVKTANILLDDNLNGKLSDFGLSRVTVDGEASHITTTVKGTAGYLDPEYFSTQMLTEKSDVYSFGVVLLEIISGRRPIDAKLSEEEINIIRWVTPYFEVIEDTDKIREIVDKRLGNDYGTKSIIHVGRLALRCVAAEPSSRPSVSEIVVEIEEAIKYENERAASYIEILEDTFIEDSQDSAVSIRDSSGPKELVSSEDGAHSTHKSRYV